MTTKARLAVAGATDPGCVRPNNEDNFSIDEELGLFVVCDGMGGHNSGEVAAEVAVKTIGEFARKMRAGPKLIVPEGGGSGASPAARQLKYFLESANTVIYEKGRAFPKDSGMGTTIVAVLADEKRLTVAHVGDSRLYLYRSGTLEPVTEDHSLVGEQVRRGLISPEQAAKSNLQNVLTRALGAEEQVEVDVADHPLLPGDVLLLATDGLTKMLSDADIAEVLSQDRPVQELVQELIGRAKRAGGVDNVTVVVAKVPPRSAGGPLQSLMSRIFGGARA